MAQELYPWQQECLTLWEQNEYRGIVKAVTGAGKTRVALAGMELLKKKAGSRLRVKIVVPGRSLLLQWKRELQKFLPGDGAGLIGLCGGGWNTFREQDYMLYVIHSARYRLARQVLHELKEGCTVLLIADECHNYVSDENRKIFEFLPFVPRLPGKYCSLGLSATADRPGYDSILVPALGPEIYHYGLARALKRGTICDFAVWQIAVRFQQSEQQEYEELSDGLKHTRTELFRLFPGLRDCSGARFFALLKEIAGKDKTRGARLAATYLQLSYQRKRVVHLAGSRIACVCRLLSHIDSRKQILIFGESIVQIEQLYELLGQSYPGKVGRYHSKMGSTANQNSLERFRGKDFRILLTCRALDEGLDVPEASVGIILSGTSMERQRLQRLGRILRRQDGKRMACLYYIFVADSQEERGYFPERLENFQVENLEFDDKTGEFYFPAYEKAAESVLQNVLSQGLPEEIYQETLECLKRGYLKEDWLLAPGECRRLAQEAKTIREQNYWICMEQMARNQGGRRSR